MTGFREGARGRPWKAALLGLFCLGWAALVEVCPVEVPAADSSLKQAAAERTRSALLTLKARRSADLPPPDPALDPEESGLIGLLFSPITSNMGSLGAKQASINPHFAAYLVEELTRAGVKEGDAVAVGLSGSFPALNVALWVALETLKARPLVVVSLAASQWGANQPGWTWLDMEDALLDSGALTTPSLALSVGGVLDQGKGMPEEGIRFLSDRIGRSGRRLLSSSDPAGGIDARMEIYRQGAGAGAGADGASIRAYVNIGGGTLSVGRKGSRGGLHPGLNRSGGGEISGEDSVAARFLRASTPVIHVTRVRELAELHGIPAVSLRDPVTPVGPLYVRRVPSRALILIGLLLILALPVGFRLAARRRERGPGSSFPVIPAKSPPPAKAAAGIQAACPSEAKPTNFPE